ncbi:MAG: hypothetical protein KME17_25110 [Cyanosarcina radialis HA8281-LM2]|jgi:hypothetical protein|nr:hypothetical protein [Cyanosarcina radialis HA8281-LM2]
MSIEFLYRRSWMMAIATGLVLIAPHASIAQTNVAKASTELPTVASAGLEPDLSVPWSKLVSVNDPFEGKFLAVFDRNDLQDKRSRKVISLWSRNSIRVLLTANQQVCSGGYGGYFPYKWGSWDGTCLERTTASTIRQLYVKVGDRVVQLPGENGNFTVNKELATALKNAPDRNANIRLVLEGGETVDSEIGQATVKVWREIYEDSN